MTTATTTSSRSQQAMFTLTPPPSEFDEVDKRALLTCSPSLSGLCYPSPAPSHDASRGSVSSDSLNLAQDDMSFSDRQQNLPQELFFGEASDASFLPISSLPEQDMALFTTSTAGYPSFISTSGYRTPPATHSRLQLLPTTTRPAPITRLLRLLCHRHSPT